MGTVTDTAAIMWLERDLQKLRLKLNIQNYPSPLPPLPYPYLLQRAMFKPIGEAQVTPTQKMATALGQALAHYEEEGTKAKDKAKEKKDDFMGIPLGKRPDALARAVLFRMSEAVEDKKDAVLAAVEQGIEPQAAEAALDELLKFGKMVQDPQLKFAATRCFKVKSKNDEGGMEAGECKWIFAVNHYPGLKESLKVLRRNGALAAVGASLQCDIATRSTAAKEVESLALKGGKGTQTNRSKKLRKKSGACSLKVDLWTRPVERLGQDFEATAAAATKIFRTEGVCSLPTGKTPEYFIKWVQRALKEWSTPAIQDEVKRFGLLPEKPVLTGLTFVQIDEFYPISPEQHNSFYHYVTNFYIKGFGLDPNKALLMDCSKIGLGSAGPSFGPTGEPQDHVSMDRMEDVWPDGSVDLSLRWREPGNHLERAQQRVLRQVDQWCAEYEAKIRALGGIGFFMGGIGAPASLRGLDQLNYQSQAAAAGDLGGIEAVRRRKVITIGLGTITYNPKCVALIPGGGRGERSRRRCKL
ncbi:unnamed protein product [Prorocentrum cordatum]|uniref:Uncharacterized protein n=1 Tax=Prorocentrum cordatum TaxID=2364126 RepID=A0ABN9S5M9_9DINO|nr:unnamed protein product [Polarella glacialis]